MRYHELFEARAMIRGNPVLLIKNPSADLVFFHIEGFRQGVARGSLIEGDVFIFDAYLATHADIENFFGVPVTNKGFDIAHHGDHFVAAAQHAAWSELVHNPYAKRILADPRVVLVTQDGEKTFGELEGY